MQRALEFLREHNEIAFATSEGNLPPFAHLPNNEAGGHNEKEVCAACARMFENEKAFARSAQGSREIKTLFNSKF